MAQIYYNGNYYTQGNARDIANLVKALENAQIYARHITVNADGSKIYYMS